MGGVSPSGWVLKHYEIKSINRNNESEAISIMPIIKEDLVEKTNQHYIPQRYLNYFTDPLTPKEQVPYIWVYDRKREAIRNRAPKNLACMNKCYNIVDSKGMESSIVEDHLKEIEDGANIALKKISELTRPSRAERLNLCKYLFSMRLRVPLFWEMYKNAVEKDKIRNLSYYNICINDLPPLIQMDSIPRVTNLVSHLLLRMDWSVLIAPKDKSFITSDNPVVVKDSKEVGLEMCGFINSIHIEVTFPLNKRMCLFGTWGRFRRIIEYITAEEVEEINFETFKYSNQYIYSSSSHFDKRILLVDHLVNLGLIN